MGMMSRLQRIKSVLRKILVHFFDDGRQFLSLGSVVLAFTLIWAAPAAQAQEACSQVFFKPLWQITPRVEKNKFVTGRGLYEYKDLLPQDFPQVLASLRADQHWIDLGAGKAKAQIEYIKSFRRHEEAAQLTAVAYKLDRWFRPGTYDGKLEIQEGAFEAQPTSSWKKADLVTDIFGVISYTHDMQGSLQKVFDLMTTGGHLYIAVTPYATQFKTQGRYLPMIDFLATIEGLKVEGRFGAIKVTKERAQIRVPNLHLLSIKDDAPPRRDFEVVD